MINLQLLSESNIIVKSTFISNWSSSSLNTSRPSDINLQLIKNELNSKGNWKREHELREYEFITIHHKTIAEGNTNALKASEP